MKLRIVLLGFWFGLSGCNLDGGSLAGSRPRNLSQDTVARNTHCLLQTTYVRGLDCPYPNDQNFQAIVILPDGRIRIWLNPMSNNGFPTITHLSYDAYDDPKDGLQAPSQEFEYDCDNSMVPEAGTSQKRVECNPKFQEAVSLENDLGLRELMLKKIVLDHLPCKTKSEYLREDDGNNANCSTFDGQNLVIGHVKFRPIYVK